MRTRHAGGRLCWSVVGTLATLVALGRADEFDAIDGRTLKQALSTPDLATARSLSFAEIAGRPALLRDTRSPLLMVRTGSGNLARLLVVPELRKPASAEGGAMPGPEVMTKDKAPAEPIPVLVLERVACFDGGDPGTRLAQGRDLVLYDGFRVDLDSGHIVPEGQGEDLIFRVGGEAGPRLEAVGLTTLVAPDRAPKGTEGASLPKLSPGRTVVARDFAGRFRLFANGQWSGPLELLVDGRGAVTGRFASDTLGTTYPVTGQVAADRPGLIRFAVEVPRTRLEFEGYLFAEGKGAIAGTVSLLERSHGFFAIRDGGRVAPPGLDEVDPSKFGPVAADPHRHVVHLAGATLTLDGNPTTQEALAPALRTLIDADPEVTVVVTADPDQSFRTVAAVVVAVRKAGVESVRMALPDATAPAASTR